MLIQDTDRKFIREKQQLLDRWRAKMETRLKIIRTKYYVKGSWMKKWEYIGGVLANKARGNMETQKVRLVEFIVTRKVASYNYCMVCGLKVNWTLMLILELVNLCTSVQIYLWEKGDFMISLKLFSSKCV